jgi:hypothetical protein
MLSEHPPSATDPPDMAERVQILQSVAGQRERLNSLGNPRRRASPTSSTTPRQQPAARRRNCARACETSAPPGCALAAPPPAESSTPRARRAGATVGEAVQRVRVPRYGPRRAGAQRRRRTWRCGWRTGASRRPGISRPACVGAGLDAGTSNPRGVRAAGVARRRVTLFARGAGRGRARGRGRG